MSFSWLIICNTGDPLIAWFLVPNGFYEFQKLLICEDAVCLNYTSFTEINIHTLFNKPQSLGRSGANYNVAVCKVVTSEVHTEVASLIRELSKIT